MENFAQLIAQHFAVDRLHRQYKFSLDKALDSADFLPSDIKKEILSGKNDLEKNINLKKVLKDYIRENKDDRRKAFLWIKKDWGRINSGTDDSFICQVELFLSQLPLGQFRAGRDMNDGLSSFSKVASFLLPEDYAIFDARVNYSLNWIISKMYEKDKDCRLIFFPQGSAPRKTLIKERPLSLIFQRFPDVKKYSKRDSYFEYCKLLKRLNPILFPANPTEIFRTEMLLFSNIEVAYKDLAKDQMGWKGFV